MSKPALQPDKFSKLKAILDLLKEDTVSSKQLAALLTPIVTLVQQTITNSKATAEQSRQTAVEAQETFQDGLLDLKALLQASDAKLTAKAQSVLDRAQAALDEVQSIEVKDGAPGQPGEKGEKGEPGSPDTPEQIVEKINSAETKIDAARIANLPEPTNRNYHLFGGSTSRIVTIQDEGTVISKLLRAMNFVGAGVQATADQNGVITITIPGGGSGSITAADELASDSGDHITFTISHTPLANTLLVINENTGQAIPASAYTNTGTSITFNTSQQVDDGTGNLVTPTFRARYFY